MPILNSAMNIPGMMVQFKDGGLALKADAAAKPNTRSVLIIGTAVDGPIMNPIAVDAETAEVVFGKGVTQSGRPNGATIPEAFSQLWKEGCRDVRVMRVSGSVSKATIAGPVKVNPVEQIVREVLGTVGGNDEQTFTLSHKLVDTTSVVVKASGQALASTAFTADHEAGTVAIVKDIATAGSEIVISYAYYPTATSIAEVVSGIADGDLEVELGHRPLVASEPTHAVPTAKVNGIAQSDISVDAATKVVTFGSVKRAIVGESSVAVLDQTEVTLAHIADAVTKVTVNDVEKVVDVDYTVADDKVTFLVALAADDVVAVDYDFTDVELKAADTVEVTYKYASGTAITVVENSSGGVQWKAAAAANQEFELSKKPKNTTAKLYTDGKESIGSGKFSIDVENQKLMLNKNFFQMGEKVEVAYTNEESSGIAPSIELETYFGGRVYDETTVTVNSVVASNGQLLAKEIVINKPMSKRANSDEQPLVYSTALYPTFGQLVDAINSDPNNGVVRANTEYELEDGNTLLDQVATNFFGGDDGLNLNKQQLFEKLSGKRDENGFLLEAGAYQLLQHYQADFILPLGCFADDELLGKYDNFAYELALFCGVASQSHLTHGIIALKPPKKTDLASVEAHVKKAVSFANNFYMRKSDGTVLSDSEGNPFDLGGYISVIAGPELTVTSTRLGTYNESGVTKYAAMLAVLKASSAPTNKKFGTVVGMRFKYSVDQLNRLAANRLVTFQQRVSDNAICPTDGVTAAKYGSDYSRVVNINVVRQCLDDIYAIAEPYIGEPISTATNNALSSAIDKKLGQRSDPMSGDIQTYSFQLISNPLDKLVGDTKIELSIVPLGERRRITVIVGLKPTL